MRNPTHGEAPEKHLPSRPYPILLKTEAEDEFASLLAELEQDIRPNTFFEQDVCARYRRPSLGNHSSSPFQNRHSQQRAS